jgi:pyruvate/2-oxoglutarate dehydrogenase complex dihydrolipoamide acyltransferase (E2) component
MNQVVVPHEIVNDESVTLVEWLVADGLEVTQGQIIARLESSKGVIDVEATGGGFIRHQANAGQDLAIGAPLCVINSAAENALPTATPAVSTPPPAAPAQAQAQAAPAVSAPAPVAPTPPSAPAALAAAPSPAPALVPTSTRLSKAALELIKARGLDPNSFVRQGLVTAARVLELLGELPVTAPAITPPPSAPATAQAPAPVPAPSRPPAGAAAWPEGVPFHSEEPTRAKRAEIQFLGASHKAVLPSLVGVVCETGGLKEAFGRAGAAGTSSMAVIVAECARLLRKYPILNAFFKDGKTHFYDEVNIGFALDAGFGLKVPVVRRADTKTAAQIETEIRDFVFQYLEKTLPVSAMAGGTFTITDLSGAGVHTFVPIINQWQGAILGVCAEFIPQGAARGSYQLVVSFDHQLAEGRVASAFLQDLRARLAGYEQALTPDAPPSLPAPPEPPKPNLECAHCQRNFHELDQLRASLLERVTADGGRDLICSLCLSGY